ncbi:MAG: hypothetical protein H5T86_13425 [Armatimonadetes bacterium]|nr:hypothetical protein [Armatimonadota bacterium]
MPEAFAWQLVGALPELLHPPASGFKRRGGWRGGDAVSGAPKFRGQWERKIDAQDRPRRTAIFARATGEGTCNR